MDPDPKSGNTSDGKRLKGNWTNDLEASFYRWQNQNESDKTIINPEVYSVVNCPIAFPPGQDSCTRYNNSQNCSNMDNLLSAHTSENRAKNGTERTIPIAKIPKIFNKAH